MGRRAHEAPRLPLLVHCAIKGPNDQKYIDAFKLGLLSWGFDPKANIDSEFWCIGQPKSKSRGVYVPVVARSLHDGIHGLLRGDEVRGERGVR